MDSKSIFASKTFWGIIFTFLVGSVPDIQRALENGFTASDLSSIVLALACSGLAITGRVTADTPVHTPRGVPGPNKEDFEGDNDEQD